MLTNYHTHTNFCDGVNTPEEMVLYAIDKGFRTLGFSGHAYTPFDLSYCIKDTEGYISKINELKEKYKGKIEIYCGVEEDAFAQADRSRFDYILGSAHYVRAGGKYCTVDMDEKSLRETVAACGGDPLRMADIYYKDFVDYILTRKPDIVGHFDLITKFDETDAPMFLGKPLYEKLAEAYIEKAARSGCVFEVNTGAVCRGYRTSPYPAENLLYILNKLGSRVVLSSDCHSAQHLDFYFNETEKILRNIGFNCVYEFTRGAFVKRNL